MSLSIKVITLELRRRLNQHANKPINTVGVFEDEDKAIAWVKKEGKNYAKSYDSPKGFYALLASYMNKEDLWLVNTVDQKGNSCYLFRGY